MSKRKSPIKTNGDEIGKAVMVPFIIALVFWLVLYAPIPGA